MLGRLVNFLLVPIYTSVFAMGEYGQISVYYSLTAFAMVVLMYGMETAFFNFCRFDKPEKVFATAQISLLVSTVLFVFVGLAGQQAVANFLEYPDQTAFVRFFVLILALDTLSNVPLAWLRFQKRPWRFGVIRLTNIGVNVGFNLMFLLLFPWMESKGMSVPLYDPNFGIGYVFLSNLLASLTMALMLSPQWKLISEGFDGELWKRMWKYGRPLIIIGLAGIVNETIDRILLKKMLPDSISDVEIGVYSAFYKLSMLMTIFVQSFRFAAEPFFFEQSHNEDSKKTYARVMHYFVIVLSAIFLGTMVFLNQIGPLVITRGEYFTHQYAGYLTPVLLMANLFLGMMYNLNIWYKLNDKMHLGRRIAIGGAVGTIVLNLLLIPFIGILGSAITTLLVYFGMMVTSYMMGQRHYPVPYNLKIIIFYIVLALVLYGFYALMCSLVPGIKLVWSFTVVLVYASLVYFIERPTKNRKFAG